MKSKIVLLMIPILFFLQWNIVLSQQIKSPIYLLNSDTVDFEKTFINPSQIKDINVVKDKSPSEIHITTKSKQFLFKTLEEILLEYTDIKHLTDSILIRINGKNTIDTADIKIDDTFFIYVIVENLSKIRYLSTAYQPLIIVSIDLESEKRPIILR